VHHWLFVSCRSEPIEMPCKSSVIYANDNSGSI
jgi:hypothetical protein